MRSIPDEFFGALLGAWVGISTKIWTAEVGQIALFFLTLALIAILLALCFHEDTKPFYRRVIVASLVALTFSSGPTLEYYGVLEPNHQLFYIALLLSWIVVGFIARYSEAHLSL